MDGLARASDTMATITEAAGFLIAAVRMLVRDAIATVVAHAVSYGAELAGTLGLATPLVLGQVTTLVALWAAKIARWLKGLLSSLRALLPIIRRLGELIGELKKILSRLRSRPETPHEPHEPPPPKKVDPKLEEQRVHDLGMDPATGKFRPGEAETAVRIENELGVKLTRAPKGAAYDWVDEAGKTYDSVGNFPPQFFARQWPQLQLQIVRHLNKAELVPVDVAKFSPDQIALIVKFIADNSLAPRVFLVGQ